MVFWKYPVSLPVEVGCGVSQGKVSFQRAAFKASRIKRGLIKKDEMARAFKVGSAACDHLLYIKSARNRNKGSRNKRYYKRSYR